MQELVPLQIDQVAEHLLAIDRQSKLKFSHVLAGRLAPEELLVDQPTDQPQRTG